MTFLDALKLRLPSGKREFYKVLDTQDFLTSDVQVFAGKWNKIGDFIVPAQNEYRFGYGSPSQPANQGYVYIYLRDTAGNEVKGKVRLAVADYNERDIKNVFEEREEVLHGDLSDKNKMKPLPDTGVTAREDMRLQIYLQPDSNATVSKANSVLYIPTTNVQL
jgi:hypothetical protein